MPYVLGVAPPPVSLHHIGGPATAAAKPQLIRGDMLRTLEHSLIRAFGFQAGNKMGFVALGLVVVFLLIRWRSPKKKHGFR